jgi:hypothetical protein
MEAAFLQALIDRRCDNEDEDDAICIDDKSCPVF